MARLSGSETTARRKVLGATPLQIIVLLSRRVLLLIVVASVIAYFAIDAWLAGFVFRAPVNLYVFVFAAAGKRCATCDQQDRLSSSACCQTDIPGSVM